MVLPTLNPIEPPWYGPVCPVVWEGWRREVSPYPDHSALRRHSASCSKGCLTTPGAGPPGWLRS